MKYRKMKVKMKHKKLKNNEIKKYNNKLEYA